VENPHPVKRRLSDAQRATSGTWTAALKKHAQKCGWRRNDDSRHEKAKRLKTRQPFAPFNLSLFSFSSFFSCVCRWRLTLLLAWALAVALLPQCGTHRVSDLGGGAAHSYRSWNTTTPTLCKACAAVATTEATAVVKPW